MCKVKMCPYSDPGDFVLRRYCHWQSPLAFTLIEVFNLPVTPENYLWTENYFWTENSRIGFLSVSN